MTRGRPISKALALVALAAMVAWPGCGDPRPMTGIDLTIAHDATSLSLDQVELTIFRSGQAWFGPEGLLDRPRPLAAEETLLIYLPADLGGEKIALELAGTSEGAPLASGQVMVDVAANRVVPARVVLMAHPVCGDGACGDDEDGCSCPADCEPNGCGDGICCPGQGEDTASCPDDCLLCGDGECGADEDGCGCPTDCTPDVCGDGRCCAERGETRATCPDDCCRGVIGLNADVRRYANGNTSVEELAFLVAATGVEVVRAPLEWYLLQAAAPPAAVDWGPFDAEAQAFADRGLCCLRYVFGTPGWASTNPAGDPPRIFPPADSADLTAFLEEAVNRHGRLGSGQVAWWQFWSQPDRPPRFDVLEPEDRLGSFLALWQTADEAILGADPLARRHSPALSDSSNSAPLDFRAGLLGAAGIDGRFGAVGYQTDGWNVVAEIQRIVAELESAGLDGRPVWIEETTNSSGGVIDDLDQARALVARVGLILGEAARLFGPGRPGVRRVLWGELRDSSANPLDPRHSGLLHRPSLSPKLSYFAFTELVRQLGGIDPSSAELLLYGVPAGVWAVRFERQAPKGPVVLAFWWDPDPARFQNRRDGEIEQLVSLDVSSLGAVQIRLRPAVPAYFGRERFACFEADDAGVVYDPDHGVELDGDSGSLSFWIRPTWNGDDGLDHNLLEYQPGAGAKLRVVKSSGSRLRAIYEVDAVRLAHGAPVDGWQAGQWHKIELEWDTAADVRRIWIDGHLADQESGSVTLPAGPGTLWVGTDQGGPSAAACLDEVRLLAASLSDRPQAAEPAWGIPFDGDSGIIRPGDEQSGPTGLESGVRYEVATAQPDGGRFDEQILDVENGRIEIQVGKTPVYLVAHQ